MEEGVTALTPLACFTSRGSLAETDPCKLAPLGGAQELTITDEFVPSGDGLTRNVAEIALTLHAEDIVTRSGAVGDDAWVVVRARGGHAIFPLVVAGAITEDNLDALVYADTEEEREAALAGTGGAPAQAITGPIYFDFDGGGYRAPFAP